MTLQPSSSVTAYYYLFFLTPQALLILNLLYVDAAGPHESRLLRKKFVDDDYLVASRPVANENNTLIVNFGISLLQIREVVSLLILLY